MGCGCGGSRYRDPDEARADRMSTTRAVNAANMRTRPTDTQSADYYYTGPRRKNAPAPKG